MLSQAKLQKAAEKFAMKYWGLEFDLQVKINSRFERTRGRVTSKRVGNKIVPFKLELSKKLLEQHKKEDVYSVLKHELCHWALITMGVKGFKDGDREFENELVRIGSHKTRTELKNVKSNRPKLIRYGIECGKCGESAGHYKTEKGAKNCVEGGRYISRCCKHQLVYSGKVEI